MGRQKGNQESALRIPNQRLALLAALFTILVSVYLLFAARRGADNDFVHYELNAQQQELQLYWRNDSGQLFNTIGNLKQWVEDKEGRLLFAANAGMFKADYSPLGLLIQEKKRVAPLDTAGGAGNFYLKPNGVFYLTTDGQAAVCATEDFRSDTSIRWATQSGPLLVIDGKIHPAFQPSSSNKNIRNGVGILPNGNVLFAMSKNEINFYRFAQYFQQQGCRQALYLDGVVCRTYLPEKGWTQTDGRLGVMVGVVERK